MVRNRSKKIPETPGHKKRAFFLVALMFFLTWTAVSRVKTASKDGGLAPDEVSKKQGKSARYLLVATTTSLYDSGLLEALIPAFEKEAGLKVKLLAVGSGEALILGRRQAADLLLVHSPDLEKKFMEDGYGQRREEFMTAEFVMAGPSSDRAKIKGLGFVEAFSRISSAEFPFVSRSDNSGTHKLEMKIWAEAGVKPAGSWYLQTGQGMGESLRIASEKQAYILTDYPTFYRFKSSLNLEVLGRDEKYKNVYSAIAVKNRTGRINAAGAEALIKFLLSEEARVLIDRFGLDSETGQPLFQALRPGDEAGESER